MNSNLIKVALVVTGAYLFFGRKARAADFPSTPVPGERLPVGPAPRPAPRPAEPPTSRDYPDEPAQIKPKAITVGGRQYVIYASGRGFQVDRMLGGVRLFTMTFSTDSESATFEPPTLEDLRTQALRDYLLFPGDAFSDAPERN
jgi:hypothetical protein